MQENSSSTGSDHAVKADEIPTNSLILNSTASIEVKNVSLVFPLVGSDSRFGQKVNQAKTPTAAVGGEIVVGKKGRVGVRALDDFSVHLKPGDRLGMFGHNGSGKSSLLRVLGGIYPPSTGTVDINGKVAGMFSLSLGINKEATGLENIKLKGLMYGLRKQQIKDLIPEISEFSELGDYLMMPMKTYSSGMIMRLLFSTASAFRPDILLLDEWVSAGDRAFRRKLNERLEEMFAQTPIVVIASHHEAVVEQWSNRSLRMVKGKAEFLS